MNVLLVSGIYPPDIGGPATYIPELEKHLKILGHDVQVISLSDSPKISKMKYPTNIFLKRNINKSIRFPLTVIGIFFLSINKDVIFVNGLYEEAACALFFTKKRKIAKIVGDPIWERLKNKQKIDYSIEKFQQISLPNSAKVQRKFLIWALNTFDVITCPSAPLQGMIRKWGVKSNIEVILNGVKTNGFKQNLEKRNSLLTVSRLVSWKNIDIILEAISHTEYHVIIAGDGPERIALETRAKELNSSAVFVGEVGPEQIQKLMDESKYFILLSEYEGMSFALLEALNHGMVPIVSDCPGNRAVISNDFNGYLIPLNDSHALLERISLLESNPSRYKYLSQNAYETVSRKYSLDSNFQKTIQLMK